MVALNIKRRQSLCSSVSRQSKRRWENAASLNDFEGQEVTRLKRYLANDLQFRRLRSVTWWLMMDIWWMCLSSRRFFKKVWTSALSFMCCQAIWWSTWSDVMIMYEDTSPLWLNFHKDWIDLNQVKSQNESFPKQQARGFIKKFNHAYQGNNIFLFQIRINLSRMLIQSQKKSFLSTSRCYTLHIKLSLLITNLTYILNTTEIHADVFVNTRILMRIGKSSQTWAALLRARKRLLIIFALCANNRRVMRFK